MYYLLNILRFVLKFVVITTNLCPLIVLPLASMESFCISINCSFVYSCDILILLYCVFFNLCAEFIMSCFSFSVLNVIFIGLILLALSSYFPILWYLVIL